MQPPYVQEVIIALMVICAFIFALTTLIYLANMGRDFDEEEPISILGYVPEKTGFRVTFVMLFLSIGLWIFYYILFKF